MAKKQSINNLYMGITDSEKEGTWKNFYTGKKIDKKFWEKRFFPFKSEPGGGTSENYALFKTKGNDVVWWDIGKSYSDDFSLDIMYGYHENGIICVEKEYNYNCELKIELVETESLSVVLLCSFTFQLGGVDGKSESVLVANIELNKPEIEFV